MTSSPATLTQPTIWETPTAEAQVGDVIRKPYCPIARVVGKEILKDGRTCLIVDFPGSGDRHVEEWVLPAIEVATLDLTKTVAEPPVSKPKTRRYQNSIDLGYKGVPTSRLPYGWKWFAQGDKHRPGFDMVGLAIDDEVNHVIPGGSKFPEFINKYLSRYETLILKPKYCS